MGEDASVSAKEDEIRRLRVACYIKDSAIRMLLDELTRHNSDYHHVSGSDVFNVAMRSLGLAPFDPSGGGTGDVSDAVGVDENGCGPNRGDEGSPGSQSPTGNSTSALSCRFR